MPAVDIVHEDTGTWTGVTSVATGNESYLADDIIIVVARSVGGGSPDLAGISGGGLTWTEFHSEFADDGAGRVTQLRCWWAHNPAAQTFSCTLTSDNPASTFSGQFIIMRAVNADPTDPIAQVAAGSFSAGTDTITIAGQDPDSATVACFMFHRTSAPTLTSPGGFTNQTNPTAALTNYRFMWALAEPAVDGSPLSFSFSPTTGYNLFVEVAFEVQPTQAGWVVGSVAIP